MSGMVTVMVTYDGGPASPSLRPGERPELDCPVIETLICDVVTPKALATPCSTVDWSKSLTLPKAVATTLTVSDKTSEYS